MPKHVYERIVSREGEAPAEPQPEGSARLGRSFALPVVPDTRDSRIGYNPLAITMLTVMLSFLCACQSAAPRLTTDQQHALDGQLILAAHGADHDEVVRLLAAGAAPNARVGDLEGDWKNLIGSTTWTAMHACLNGPGDADRYPICVALLDAGADINAADSHGATALYAAISRPDSEVALMLIRRGAEVNTVTGCYIDSDQGSPLWRAVKEGNRAVVASLLRAGADTEVRSVFDWTPLLQAVKAEDEWMVWALIEAGADVDAGRAYADPEAGLFADEDRYVKTPLLMSIDWETEFYDPIVRLLHEAGATVGDLEKVDVMDAFGDARHDQDYVELMIDQGLSPMFADEEGRTPVHFMAGDRRAFYSLRYLLEEDLIEADMADADGDTPLSYAILAGALENAALLLAHGADPNTRDQIFGGYLHYAIVDGDVALVALLFAYGADPMVENDQDESALQAAQEMPYASSPRITELIHAAIETRGDDSGE